MTKDEIIAELKTVSDQFVSDCSTIPEQLFFNQPAEKWSIAQNVAHLTTAANMTRLAYQLPKFIVRVYGGTPNRQSRSYEELVTKYKTKLQEGGKASGLYIPKNVESSKGKEQVISQFKKAMFKLNRAFRKNWKEEQLDDYLAPHPLLGKLTLRELGYFTIYHTIHHDSIIKLRLQG
jgi:hypothetical protein